MQKTKNHNKILLLSANTTQTKKNYIDLIESTKKSVLMQRKSVLMQKIENDNKILPLSGNTTQTKKNYFDLSNLLKNLF